MGRGAGSGLVPKNFRDGGGLCAICHQIFKEAKNQRGPLEIEIFLLRGVNERARGLFL